MPVDIARDGGGADGFGIPTKYLVIGGGAALVGLFLFMNRGGGSAGNTGASENGVYGPALGPNAALALGDLQNQFLKQVGLLQEQSQQQYEGITGAIGTSQSDLYEGITGAIGAAQSGLYEGITGAIGKSEADLSSHLDAQAQALSDQGAATQAWLNQFGQLTMRINDRNEQINARQEQIQFERYQEYQNVMNTLAHIQGR